MKLTYPLLSSEEREQAKKFRLEKCGIDNHEALIESIWQAEKKC